MLVLSRKKDERVVIGTGPTTVTVKVVEVRGDKVRLGFEAAKEVPIDREEVYEAKQREAEPLSC